MVTGLPDSLVRERQLETGHELAVVSGDRIPDRPWLHANASASVRWAGLATARDELSFNGYGSYAGSFFRSWESAGRADDKIEIESQWFQSIALTYVMRSALTTSLTFDVSNLFDIRAYDFLGVQRPGRAFSIKGTVEN